MERIVWSDGLGRGKDGLGRRDKALLCVILVKTKVQRDEKWTELRCVLPGLLHLSGHQWTYPPSSCELEAGPHQPHSHLRDGVEG